MSLKKIGSFVLPGLFILVLLLSPFASAPVVAEQPPVEKGVAWLPENKWRNADGTYNWQGIESDLTDIQNAGITWVRVIFYENAPSSYFAQLVTRIKAHNLKILVRVMKSYPANDLGNATQQANYKTWLSGVVTTYRNDIRYWEIHNEPNLAKYWNIDHQPGSDPTQYALSVQNYIKHLQNSYVTIKAIDPTLNVLIGGLSEWYVERYMDQLIAQDAHQFFDMMAYHPYGRNPDLAIGRVHALKAKMALDPDLVNKVIWITEVGFHTELEWKYTAPGWVPDEDTKADYLLQTMQRLSTIPGVASPLFWFNFSEWESTRSGFGLVIKDRVTLQATYQPAYYAWKELWVTKFLAILNPVADSYVNSAYPNANYGASSQMRVNNAAQAVQIAYMRFDTSAYANVTLYKTRLKIQTVNGPGSGSAETQRVKIAYNAVWNESTINYTNRPALNASPIGSLSNTTIPTWYYMWLNYTPLQNLIGGMVTLGMDSNGASDELRFHSKESQTPPQLLLYYTTN
jgi:hypothetical protein